MRNFLRVFVIFFLIVDWGFGQPVQSPFQASLPLPDLVDNTPPGSPTLSLTTIASNLDVPWDIAWGPDNWLWYAEQGGTISKVNPATGERKLILRIFPDVFRYRTRGLLCMALHPDMERFPFVVVNYHFMKDQEVWSRWARYTYDGETLTKPVTLLEVPSKAGHNGSRAAISPDGEIMMAIGDEDSRNDAANSGVAQNMDMVGGKILRLNSDGSIPDDNPFPGSPVWALGFRVPQGLVHAANGKLYSAEHGHVTNDEVNLVRKGANYGYPNVSGVCDQPHEIDFCATHAVAGPLMAWTPTIAPSGMDYYNHNAIPEWKNALLLVTLKTQSLRVLKLNDSGSAIVKEETYFEKRFGRLRDVCVSPEGDVYIATSNLDWNPVEGFPTDKDDRIIRISASKSGKPAAGAPDVVRKASSSSSLKLKTAENGSMLYGNYCASCHKADGTGLPGTFPALKGSPNIIGNKQNLIRIVLQGLAGPSTVGREKYDMEMPAFHFLSDQDVADVAAYVRSAFGESQETITADDVSRIRGERKR